MKKFYPSMMCADFTCLAEETKKLSQTGIDGLHIDIMDGDFVPNFGMSPEDVKAISLNTNKLLDIHLMINHPERYVKLFAELGAGRMYIHPETTSQPARVLIQIKDMGIEAGIAISPGTSISTISELLRISDYVLIMTVNPGFAGQQYLDFVDEKVKILNHFQKENKFEMVVDGAISPTRIKKLSEIGVTGFVLGTSSLFGKKESYGEIIKSLHEI